MDASTVISIVQSVGFPIVMCGAMGLFVKYMYDKNNKEREELLKLHAEEMASVTDALNNNTVAITKLCERMDRDGN